MRIQLYNTHSAFHYDLPGYSKSECTCCFRANQNFVVLFGSSALLHSLARMQLVRFVQLFPAASLTSQRCHGVAG